MIPHLKTGDNMIKKTLTLSFIVFQLVLTEFHLVIFLFLCEHQWDAPSTNFPIFQCCQHCFQYSDVANIVFNIQLLPTLFSIFQCCQHLVLYTFSWSQSCKWTDQWLIDWFNSTSTCLGLFHTYRLGNRIHYMFRFTFFVQLFLKNFCCCTLSN